MPGWGATITARRNRAAPATEESSGHTVIHWIGLIGVVLSGRELEAVVDSGPN